MNRVIEHRVTSAQDGCFLRDLLRRELSISAKLLARIKRTAGGITLNGEAAHVNVRVKQGDIVKVIIENNENACANLIPVPGELDIYYEDEDILVINKPAGIPVQPAIGAPEGALGNIVVWHYAQKGENVIFRPVNRLDSGTSGLMAVAKNSHVHTALIKTLHTGQFKRKYRAIVHGRFDVECGSVEAPVCREEGSVLKRTVHPDGKWAKTNYRVLEEIGDCSLIELELMSGRTHQIRVHMAHIGHPLVGDFLYGREEQEIIGRFALHSSEMNFAHPISGEEVILECDLPEDMRAAMRKIAGI